MNLFSNIKLSILYNWYNMCNKSLLLLLFIIIIVQNIIFSQERNISQLGN